MGCHSRLPFCTLGWILLLLGTGTLNIIGIKLMNVKEVRSSDGVHRKFNQPFLQTWSSYFGGTGILIIYLFYKAVSSWVSRTSTRVDYLAEERKSVWFFLPPGLFDLSSTALTFVALLFINPSSCMMLRGIVIVFTAFLSRFFLGRTITNYQVVGIIVIFAGLVTVGLTDLKNNNPVEVISRGDINLLSDAPDDTVVEDAPPAVPLKYHSQSDVLWGYFLVIFSQTLVAIQYVYEEKYISKTRFPIALAVGLEALFALIFMSVLLVPLYFIQGDERFSDNPRGVVEDSLEGLRHLGANPVLLALAILVSISIGLYNLAGLSITRILSATTRVVLDSVRTLNIWVLSIIFGWQDFQWMHLLGFTIYLLGLLTFHLDDINGECHCCGCRTTEMTAA